MLHQGSNFNLVENNTAYDNVDNFVIFQSQFNVVRSNIWRDAKETNIRINEPADMNYIIGNTISGCKKGIFLYGGVARTVIQKNKIATKGLVLVLRTGSDGVIFTDNQITKPAFRFKDAKNIIIENNTVTSLTTSASQGN